MGVEEKDWAYNAAKRSGDAETAEKIKREYDPINKDSGNDEERAAASARLDAAQSAFDNAYQYGGSNDAGQRAVSMYGRHADNALDRQAGFYGDAAFDRGLGLEARGSQLTAADLMLARAQGRAPSIAQQQASLQMGQLASEQASAAASARGPAALALAQQGAAANTATGQSAISGQAQINAAMERERAEQAAFGAYSGIRGQDNQSQQLSQGAAMGAGQQALGYHGLQHGVQTSRLQAQGNREGQKAAIQFGQAAQDAQRKAQQDANTNGWIGAGATLGMGAMMLMSDERAKQPASLGMPAGTQPKPMSVTNGPAPNSTQQAGSSQALGPRIVTGAANGTSMGRGAHLDQFGQVSKPVVGKSLTDGGEMRAGYGWGNPTAPARPNYNPGRMNPGAAPAQVAAARPDFEAANQPQAPQVSGYGTPPLPMPGGGQQAMYSDERAKNGAGWGSPGIAPGESQAMPSTYEQSRQAAARALDEQEAKEARARAYGTPTASMPDMHGGVEALDRYEQDQVDTLKAKDRHGVELTPKEQRMKEAAQKGQKYGAARGRPDKPPAGAAGSPEKPSATDTAAKEAAGGWSKNQMAGLQTIAGIGQGLMARGQAGGGGGFNFYTPAQQQQITSDMGAKNLGSAAMYSDMGTKRLSSADMISDMGAKQQAPMYSDDRTKLAAAWDQGHQAALADVEKASKMSPDELKKRKGTPAVDVARNVKANAWDEGHGANARESAKLAQASVQRAAQKEPGFDVPGSAPTAGDKLLGNISDASNRALEHVVDDEPRQMVPGTLSSRLRARAGAMARPNPEPASLPAGGGSRSAGHREEEAEMYSDERAKNRMSDADAAKLSAQADKEIAAMRGAAKSMEASPYSYKDEFRPPEQAPGEVNVGPMAQKMAADPVARTAVRQDPQTGLLSLDRDKMLKVLAGTSAAQQKQLDEANRQIAVLKRDGDRSSYFDSKADRLKGEADREIQNLRSASERGPSVIDRDRPAAPPSWLSKYMNDDGEEEQRARRRLTSADFITRRRKA